MLDVGVPGQLEYPQGSAGDLFFRRAKAETMDSGPFGSCANCGKQFEPNVTYPVETREAADGTLQLYSFCDDDCQRAWQAG